MKIVNKIAFAFILALGSLVTQAQQVPMYTHYMDNTLIINPAYAGSRDALTITALSRSQWVDFKGAPTTQTLTMHAPLRNEHLGIGLSVLNDKIGPANNTGVVADFAYIMKLTAKAKLSLGLSAGVNIMKANLSSLQTDQQNDPAFLNNIDNHVTPSVGFGAYYYRERFYAGVSTPNLLENSYQSNNASSGSTEQRHYFFIAGAVFKLSDNLDLKPTTLVKVTPSAPAQVDVTGSFIIAKKLTLGAMYRTSDAVGALIGLNITEQLHIGYSYDWSYGLKTPEYNQGSHEIMLRYDFIFFDKRQVHSPRYF